MNLSKFFIDRPIFAGVLSLLMFLAGLLTYLSSFFIGPAADEAEQAGARLAAA
mgnify:CR=1 FL=1